MNIVSQKKTNWIKQGLLFKPPQGDTWLQSYAQVPTVLVKKDRLRVYFSSRPHKKLSLTTFVDLDLNDFSKVLYQHSDPILDPGRPGTFDEHGIMPASVVAKGDLIYLYYSGWQQAVSVPYNNYTGLAISSDGGTTFTKHSEGPIIDRTQHELYSATSPDVLREESCWYMWYSSGTYWLDLAEKLEHTYEIKLATSPDGKTWLQTNKTAIAQTDKYEAITRPTVIKIGDTWHMWYCYRGSKNFRTGSDSYRIGYATSDDLILWHREDNNSGIDISEHGWDSMMIAYPCVFKANGKTHMFYNGNNFGEQGFGHAILENEGQNLENT